MSFRINLEELENRIEWKEVVPAKHGRELCSPLIMTFFRYLFVLKFLKQYRVHHLQLETMDGSRDILPIIRHQTRSRLLDLAI